LIDYGLFFHYNGVKIITFPKKRRISMKKILALILAVTFVLASVPAFAGNENDRDIANDIIFARPIGFASIVAGAGLFIVSLPLAIISGSVNKTGQALVGNPIKYTLARPIGDFEYSVDAAMEDTNYNK
jgi:hypothetical protein